ncbi:MAG: 5-amino-6-(D-ribitylamino)uracil--L-tyrosine 4-hydroxyphenyl transferase CofH [Methanogenium sp.]|jgi:FO synthase subunit 2
MKELLEDVLEGHRLTPAEAAVLLKAHGSDVWEIATAADILREQTVGDVVTYVRNQNIHVTNICRNLCQFCAFGRPSGAPDAYDVGDAGIRAQVTLAKERGVTELCFLSGVNPAFSAERYAEMIGIAHKILPEADIHTMSPDEVTWAARKSGITTAEVIEMTRDAGLGTMQGTGAEILVDSVRKRFCPNKVNTAEWARIITEAHLMGLKSTATIMYGSLDTADDRAEHLGVIRDIQDETDGFTEFIPLPFIHENTPLQQAGLVSGGSSGREDILLFAVSRLFFDNIPNIQMSWGKIGGRMASLGLIAGGNDFGGTMFTDEVSVDAGALGADYLDPADMKRITDDLGRVLRRRSTVYELLD